ncbi:hypothetical protein DFH28DRAFT_893991 [Melampsora americana]|nr:hypothetical protein DFH28DRAFT_893991 [Melampsora americana]
MSNNAYENEDRKPLAMTIKPTWPPVFPLCANDRHAWTLQAKAGGLGTGTAKCDHITEDSQELMYLKGDRITILVPMLNSYSNSYSNSDPNLEKFTFLGFCEGQIGFVSIQNLKFHSPIRNNPAYLQELFNDLEHRTSSPHKSKIEKSYNDHPRGPDFDPVERLGSGTSNSFPDSSKRNSVHIKSSNPNFISRRRQISSPSSTCTGVTGITDLSSQDSSIIPPPLPPPSLPSRTSSFSSSPQFLKQNPLPNTEADENSSRMRKISLNSMGSSPRHSIIKQSSSRELSTKSSFTLPKRNKPEKSKHKRNSSKSRSLQISGPVLTGHTNPMIESTTGIAATPHRDLVTKASNRSLSGKDNGTRDLTEELNNLASSSKQDTRPSPPTVTCTIPAPDHVVPHGIKSPARSHSFLSSTSSSPSTQPNSNFPPTPVTSHCLGDRLKKSSKEPSVLDYNAEGIITTKGGSAFELVKPQTITKTRSKAHLMNPDEIVLNKLEVEIERFADEFEKDMERTVEVPYPSTNQDLTVLEYEEMNDHETHPDESIIEDGESYRIKEQKWVQVLNSSSNKKDNKKIKKLIKNGLPKSLRGRIWGYLLNLNSQLKVQGLFEKVLVLIDEAFDLDEVLIDSDLEKICRQFDFHSFSKHDSTGISDLETLIKSVRTYSKLYLPNERSLDFDLSLLGGLLLIQSPLEEAFWNLLGIATIGFPNLWNQRGFLYACDRFTRILEDNDSVLSNHLVSCFLITFPFADRALSDDSSFSWIVLCRISFISIHRSTYILTF